MGGLAQAAACDAETFLDSLKIYKKRSLRGSTFCAWNEFHVVSVICLALQRVSERI